LGQGAGVPRNGNLLGQGACEKNSFPLASQHNRRSLRRKEPQMAKAESQTQKDATPKISIMTDQHSAQASRQDDFLAELETTISDRVHNRLIKAYRGKDPTTSMESELKAILLEILQRED
jgi:hypothetical protein